MAEMVVGSPPEKVRRRNPAHGRLEDVCANPDRISLAFHLEQNGAIPPVAVVR